MSKYKVMKGTIHSWKKYKVDFSKLNKAERKILRKALPEIADREYGEYILGIMGRKDNWIRTSYIVKHEGDLIETINSIYQLGEEDV